MLVVKYRKKAQFSNDIIAISPLDGVVYLLCSIKERKRGLVSVFRDIILDFVELF